MYIYILVDSLIGIIMADEKLLKIYCSLCNWLLHDHTDSFRMNYFNIQRKRRRQLGGVACAVACQMPVH